MRLGYELGRRVNIGSIQSRRARQSQAVCVCDSVRTSPNRFTRPYDKNFRVSAALAEVCALLSAIPVRLEPRAKGRLFALGVKVTRKWACASVLGP